MSSDDVRWLRAIKIVPFDIPELPRQAPAPAEPVDSFDIDVEIDGDEAIMSVADFRSLTDANRRFHEENAEISAGAKEHERNARKRKSAAYSMMFVVGFLLIAIVVTK